MAGYSAAEVSELLDWPVSRLYALVRDGLIKPQRAPNGAYRFAFGELVTLRAIRELIHQGVAPRRIKRSLKILQQRLPDGRPLSTVKLASAGARVVVRDGSLWFEPESGQGQLLLDPAASSTPRPLRPCADGDAYYDQALELEENDPEAAIAAYRQAIALDDRHADAHINLGRLLQAREQLDEAEQHYRAALEREADHPLALFNLGTVLEDRGQLEAAIESYNRCADELPDAHYNLARLYESMNRRSEAIAHLKALKLLCR